MMARRKKAVTLKTDIRVVALYARISNEDRKNEQGQLSEESVDDQLERLRAEARRRFPDATVIAYVDNDLSASTFATKPRVQFDDMINAFYANELDAVIATRSDRLTRNGPDGYLLADAVLKHGGCVCTLVGDKDLVTDGGFVWKLDVLLGERESHITSWRVSNKLDTRRGKGVYRCSRVPFGYSDTACTEVIESEKAWLHEMRKHIMNNGTIGGCWLMLAEGGVTSPVAKKNGTFGPFSRQAVTGFLRNPIYAGYVPHEGAKVRKSTHIVPIFTDDEFDTLQERLDQISDDAKQKRGGTVVSARVHVLSGFLRCGQPGCGGRMQIHGPENHRSWECVECNGSRRRYATVATVVDAWVRTRLRLAAVEVADEAMADPQAVKLRRELSELEARRTRMTARLATLEISEDDYYPAIAALRDAITTRQSELARMVRDAERALPPDALALWEDDRPEMLAQRRALLGTLIDHVAIVPVPLPPGRKSWGRAGAPPESVRVFARRAAVNMRMSSAA